MRDQKIPIAAYVMGDISSTIYPVKGGLEDWAYGAGWDYSGTDATLTNCNPSTYVLPENIQTNKEAYKNVRSAIYIVETDFSKRPSDKFLGSRQIYKTKEGKIRINPDSIQNNQHDGHINRNIRLALALIDVV